MAAGIATGFVRKLYRILDQESGAIISWDASGASFSVHDSEKLNALVLPRYFRGRLSAFRQQLADHGFRPLEVEDDDSREAYAHADFLRGCPGRLSRIVRTPRAKRRKDAADGGAPTAAPSTSSLRPPASLKVTLTAMGSGKKRPGTAAAPASPAKRLRADAGGVPAAASKEKNPLFSNDADDDGAFSIARLIEGGGLLPASSELPDPISYLIRAGGGSQPQPAARPQATTTANPAGFSDDLVRSALYFLVSTSVTGTEPAAGAGEKDKKAKPDGHAAGRTHEARADVLASLLASSTSGAPAAASGWAASGASNPLFSDQSTGDEEDDENSIWSLLLASSVDRVKAAVGDAADPQEKLRRIIAERERLEAQRAKVGVPAVAAKPAVRPATAGAGDKATEAAAGTSRAPAAPSEDDLWRLLMSSSIDVFRSLEQHQV